MVPLFSKTIVGSLHFTLPRRGHWLRKAANIKDKNNGAAVYLGSTLVVHNPLFFVPSNLAAIPPYSKSAMKN